VMSSAGFLFLFKAPPGGGGRGVGGRAEDTSERRTEPDASPLFGGEAQGGRAGSVRSERENKGYGAKAACVPFWGWVGGVSG